MMTGSINGVTESLTISRGSAERELTRKRVGIKMYYQDHHITLYNKDCRDMAELSDECVQMVCTSPPYWGLRKYAGVPDLIWGGKDCEHEWTPETRAGLSGGTNCKAIGGWAGGSVGQETTFKDITTNTCTICGAWKGSYGLEPTPEMYIDHTIEILREIRRVLRKDGVVFWNIGDSYWGGKGQSGQPMSADTQQERHGRGESINQSQHQLEMAKRPQDGKHYTIKPKDLCLIPFKVAIAAQEDGWWVRSVIIWSKPNPMPESVTDRPTNSHEYILMLTKSSKYYWDADAVREPANPDSYRTERPMTSGAMAQKSSFTRGHPQGRTCGVGSEIGRNIRDVWEFPTQPYPEAHFAIFPEKLPETCIKASTPEEGCCSKCGAPWTRVLTKGFTSHDGESKTAYTNEEGHNANQLAKLRQASRAAGGEYRNTKETIGWQSTCKCNADKSQSIVLDPFAGAGTTLWIAKKLNRKAVGYELSKEYCELIVKRNSQQVMI